MTQKVRNTRSVGGAPLSIVTRYNTENSYLGGALHTRRGWHWWWEALSPDGEPLSSVTKGPYSTEEEALAHAEALLGSNSGVPVVWPESRPASLDVGHAAQLLDWRGSLEEVAQVVATLVAPYRLRLHVEYGGDSALLALDWLQNSTD